MVFSIPSLYRLMLCCAVLCEISDLAFLMVATSSSANPHIFRKCHFAGPERPADHKICLQPPGTISGSHYYITSSTDPLFFLNTTFRCKAEPTHLGPIKPISLLLFLFRLPLTTTTPTSHTSTLNNGQSCTRIKVGQQDSTPHSRSRPGPCRSAQTKTLEAIPGHQGEGRSARFWRMVLHRVREMV